MSLKAAQDFLKKLESDQDLKVKFKEAPDADTRHQMAKAAGFDFTLDEFKQALDELMAGVGEGELTPEQLQGVAGGHWCAFHHAKHDISEAGHEVVHEGSSSSHEVTENPAVTHVVESAADDS